MKPRKTEVARGWGLRVNDRHPGGPSPYIAYVFSFNKDEMEKELADLECEHLVRVVLVPLAEYRRLKRLEKKVNPCRR